MRGQISLDFLLAMILTMVAISTVAVVGAQISEMQKQSTVGRQLDLIGTELASAISLSALLSDSDTANLTFDLPYIAVPGQANLQECEIDILGDTLTLGYPDNVSPIASASKKFEMPAGMTLPGSAKCGDTITITK